MNPRASSTPREGLRTPRSGFMTKTPGYRRLNAMTFAAPAGFRIFQKTSDVRADLAHLRMYSEDPAKIGDRMRLEVFPEGIEGKSVVLFAEVAWVTQFEADEPAPAPFELGLDVTWMAVEDEDALASIL